MATTRPHEGTAAAPRRRRRRELHPFVFIAPALLLLLLLLVVPIIQALRSSMIVADQISFGNYVRVFTADDLARRAFGHTLIFAAASTAGQYLVGLGVALVLNTRLPAPGVLRLAFLVPWMFPAVIPGIVWRWMLDGQFGIINELLRQLGLIEAYVAWLGNPRTALGAVIVANIWRGFPLMMVLLLAGLQAIPRDLYEAAAVDGANGWQRLRRITMPLIAGVSLIAALLSWIGNFMNFALVRVMTDGGPANSSEVLATLIFKNAFTYMDLNYAAALGIVLLFFLMIPGSAYVHATLRER
jgi:multiple sugar transport system permease protein